MLKLYSAFFRRFLEYPDPNASKNDQFGFNFESVVDDDGEWGLEKGRKVSYWRSGMEEADIM